MRVDPRACGVAYSIQGDSYIGGGRSPRMRGSPFRQYLAAMRLCMRSRLFSVALIDNSAYFKPVFISRLPVFWGAFLDEPK